MTLYDITFIYKGEDNSEGRILSVGTSPEDAVLNAKESMPWHRKLLIDDRYPLRAKPISEVMGYAITLEAIAQGPSFHPRKEAAA